jgi:hypothetical protein
MGFKIHAGEFYISCEIDPLSRMTDAQIKLELSQQKKQMRGLRR